MKWSRPSVPSAYFIPKEFPWIFSPSPTNLSYPSRLASSSNRVWSWFTTLTLYENKPALTRKVFYIGFWDAGKIFVLSTMCSVCIMWYVYVALGINLYFAGGNHYSTLAASFFIPGTPASYRYLAPLLDHSWSIWEVRLECFCIFTSFFSNQCWFQRVRSYLPITHQVPSTP